MITTICQECSIHFDYDLKPGFPRKYCTECSAKKKAAYENRSSNPTATTLTQAPLVQQRAPSKEIKAPTGEYQSLVYNKTLAANSYEVGTAGNRFKLYFETVEDLQVKMRELKDAGFMKDYVEGIEI